MTADRMRDAMTPANHGAACMCAICSTSATDAELAPIVAVGADGVATTDTERIAVGTHNDHASVLRLVRDNLDDLNEFGGVGFEIRSFATAGGQQQRQVAILTEEHATLLMTYMRNSAVVRDFKKRLVREFYAMRRAAAGSDIDVPRTLPDALRAYAREVEAREAAEAYASELEPKAEYVDRFVSPDDCVQIRSLANQLDVSERALRELLVEKRWVYKTLIGKRFSKKHNRVVEEWEWRAYADRKAYFRLIPQHNAPRHHNNQVRQTLYVTPPGARAIRELQGVRA